MIDTKINDYKKNKTKTNISVLRVLFLTYSIACLVVVSLVFVFISPSITMPYMVRYNQELLTPYKSTTFLDRDNKPMIDSFNFCPTNISALKQHTIDSFLTIEDNNFFKHNGLDTKRILKAIIKNILSRQYIQGASTITQQLAKNTHLSQQKNLRRKANELRLARAIEHTHSKQDILKMYFDILYFGRGIYGLGSASYAFFGVDCADLTLLQSAYLASIINNPTIYSPYNNKSKLNSRKNLVLTQMYKYNKITKAELDDNKAREANFLTLDNSFVQTRLVAMAQFENQNSAINKKQLEKLSIIKTSIDSDLTRFVKELLDKNTPRDCMSSVYIVENDSNNALACYSTDNNNMYNVNRQIGSTIKPIASYTPALQQNLITTTTHINDAKTEYNGWTPNNYKDRYQGYITASNALATSSNTVAVKLLSQVGIDNALATLNDFGLQIKGQKDLSIALGATSHGFSLIQLVDAYTTFPNLGQYAQSKTIMQNNSFLYNNKNWAYQKPIIRDDTAHLINSMLLECANSGTAKRLGSLPYQVCAKTGTVGFDTHNTDAYSIAYTSKHTVGLWIGGDNMSNDITGGTLATTLVKQIFKYMYQNYTPQPLNKSDKVIMRYIDDNELINNHEVVEAHNNQKSHSKTLCEFSIFNQPKSNTPPITTKEQMYTQLLDTQNQLTLNNKHYYYYYELLKKRNKVQ